MRFFVIIFFDIVIIYYFNNLIIPIILFTISEHIAHRLTHSYAVNSPRASKYDN